MISIPPNGIVPLNVVIHGICLIPQGIAGRDCFLYCNTGSAYNKKYGEKDCSAAEEEPLP